MKYKKLTHKEVAAHKLSSKDLETKERFPVYALLDNIRSLHNVGAIFRTSDACLVKKVFLCGITGYPPRPEIEKTALGATEVVPWEYYPSSVDAIKRLKAEGVFIVGLELAHGSKSFKDFDYPLPCCVVIGHEKDGISDEVFDLLDSVVEIPMHGMANSLNVATAYGVLLYEIVENF